jgi:ACS family pantothenate transporter-like MFS transporter
MTFLALLNLHILTLYQFFGFISSLFLAIWMVPSGLKWFSYFVNRASVPYGPLSMSWANEICAGDAEERALVLGIMNASGYAFNAWLPLLTYPAKQAPRFKKGFTFSTVAFVAQFGITGLVAWLWSLEKKRKVRSEIVERAEFDDGIAV